MLTFAAVLMALVASPRAMSESSDVPTLTAEQMNCAFYHTAVAPPSAAELPTAAETRVSLKDLNQRYNSGRIKFAPSSFRHPARIDSGYLVYVCKLVTSGHKFLLLNGVPSISGGYNCHNPGGFGVIYDPSTRKFGQMVIGVDLCAVHH